MIGNPLGEEFARTLTVGVVSALDREVTDTTTDRYAARIWWSGSVSETQYWSLDADRDPATGSLVASGETMLLTYLPDGTVDPSADQHVRETTAVFSLNEENSIVTNVSGTNTGTIVTV